MSKEKTKILFVCSMPNNLLNSAKSVILTEAQALTQLAEKLDQSFVDACTLIQP
jgi:arabinose-5-phosphate isomerase